MKNYDNDYHVSGEFHALIAQKAIKNTSNQFQARMRTLATALALCLEEFDGSMLYELYELTYVKLAKDKQRDVDTREHAFPRPRYIAYTREGDINVEMTMECQRNYFTSASTAYLKPLGIPLYKVPPHRKASHDLVYQYQSILHSTKPDSRLRVAAPLRDLIVETFG